MSTDQASGQQPQQERGQSGISTFTVEFADDYCRNFTISAPPLQGADIRGRWDTARLARRPQRMRDLGTMANRIPSPIPGAMLRVDVRRKNIRLFDPLGDSEAGKKILAEYNAIAKDIPALKKDCKAFEAVEKEVDDDQLKTLLLELLRKKESDCIVVVEGELPTVAQIEKLAGHELYDPSNPGDDKPRYKKDLQKFRDRQRAAGV